MFHQDVVQLFTHSKNLARLNINIRRLPLESTVVLYCGGGARSALACKSLTEMGYDKVENLEGGWHGWVGSGLPVEQP